MNGGCVWARLAPLFLVVGGLPLMVGPAPAADEGSLADEILIEPVPVEPAEGPESPGVTELPDAAEPGDPLGVLPADLPEGEDREEGLSEWELPEIPEMPEALEEDRFLVDHDEFIDPAPGDPAGTVLPDAAAPELDVEWGPIGLGQSARPAQEFGAGILGDELLLGGSPAPLDRQGFQFGLGSQFIYDSNLFLTALNPQSDLSFVVSPGIDFRSAPEGVPGIFAFSYTPFFRKYFSETDLDTIDHSASARLGFDGVRGRFDLAANYGRFSNADRFVGGRVDTETFSLRASGAYALSARTSIEASLSASRSEDAGPAGTLLPLPANQNDVLHFQVAGFWQATTRTRFGPSLRYSASRSDNIGDRDSLALLLAADFVPNDRLSLYASAGIESVSEEFGGNATTQDSTDFTGSFGCRYQPDDRFALGVDLSYQAIPQGSGRASRSGGGEQSLIGGVTLTYLPNPDWSVEVGVSADSFPLANTANYSQSVLQYRAAVSRRLGDGSLSLSGSFSSSEAEAVGNVAVPQSDEDFRSLSLRYQHPAFGGRGRFESGIQWSDSTGLMNWERFQVTTGLSLAF